MELSLARELAEKACRFLRPSCSRIEIAGSIRRGKPQVKDIEIVAEPADPFFEFTVGQAFGTCKYIKNGPRYKQIVLPEGINLDLFIVLPPVQWGLTLVLRTGPAEFSHAAVTKRFAGGLLPSSCTVQDGQVWRDGKSIPMDEEEDFLRLLGMEGVPPGQRPDTFGALRTSREQAYRSMTTED